MTAAPPYPGAPIPPPRPYGAPPPVYASPSRRADGSGVVYPNVPVLSKGAAWGVLVVNVFLPGVGTIIAGVVGKHRMIGRGFAQFFLTLVVVGWFWALVTSIQCLTNAK